MMIPKSNWTIYTMMSSDLSRIVTSQSKFGRNLLSLKYKDNELVVRTSPAGYNNLHFTTKKDTRTAYGTKKDDSIDCYRLNLPDYGYVYIPVQAFLEDHYGSNLNLVKELPDYIIDSDINNSKVDDILTDFIYKINDSNKLKIHNECDSIEEFFEVDVDTNPIYLEILTIDTKETIAKIERSNRGCKFIVELTNENGEDFIVRSFIYNQQDLNDLITNTIESLRNYKQFSKYADDLEEAIN